MTTIKKGFSMTKKICLLPALLLFSVLLFAGCASEVELWAVQGADGTEYVLAVKLDKDEEAFLNGTARSESAVKHADSKNISGVGAWTAGEPWTVEQYLTYAMHLCGIDRDAEYEKKPPPGRKILAFRLKNTSAGGTAKVVESYPYINIYEFRAPNPFDAYRAQFDRPAADTPFDIFKNGKAKDGIPSFSAAFPSGRNLDLESLELDVKYTMKNFSRYELVDGAEKKYDEETGHNVYSFYGKFDKKDKEIVFRFIRPNQTWWYVTAILAGFAAVGLVFLVVKYKKKQPPPPALSQSNYPLGSPPDPFASADPFAKASDPFAPEPAAPRSKDPFEN